ncbi:MULTISPECIES: LysR family transcriptional regulator [Rhizobium]|uniref:LysR family transcriptional activator of mexEF-oprN operon n=1 Tax=Rhizobium tropici TaxID=398 RepID=A0A6P1CAN1_RHITR|nr:MULTISPECIES: LysR family transcriptional regulator [Rhizobium]AGB73978.1 transcriptional regulator MexT [Rhizobium tropici CIAT 899]MBB4240462.1 LysR family transcriptional activator of mexEF-oprN operon [Rhizobium tropici]MBB5592122.1 LysR family transcriptional activator of mexEF-oprN operon [Rhizobium tropici]MBB6491177.1 LysR family transcriptional activator of mexEF-oprN operon [Rhizobium tropici]NEV14188.1 LysR family transcriptional regulator [Rhizobium tropici]
MKNKFTQNENSLSQHWGTFNEHELRRVDLNLLLVFSAVMREGGVKGAARRLYLGPSGISMALTRLRTVLATDLFVRGKTGLVPTPFAQQLYERILPALTEINAALLVGTGFEPATATRSVRLAMTDDIEINLAPRLISRLQKEAPNMDLVIRSGNYSNAAAMLDEDLIDLVICARPSRQDARHRTLRLYTESFMVLAGAKTEAECTMTLQAYTATPHALVSANGLSSGLIDDSLRQLGASRRIAVVVERFSTLPHLLKSANLLANVPSISARVFATTFGLTSYKLPFASPQFEVVAMWYGKSDVDPVQTWVRSLVKQETAALRAQMAIDDQEFLS